MPDDLLPPGGDPPDPGPRDRRPLTCEFCECRLIRHSGEILTLSDRARTFRNSADAIEALKRQITKLEGDLATTQRALTEATTVRETDRPFAWEV